MLQTFMAPPGEQKKKKNEILQKYQTILLTFIILHYFLAIIKTFF